MLYALRLAPNIESVRYALLEKSFSGSSIFPFFFPAATNAVVDLIGSIDNEQFDETRNTFAN